MKGDIHNQGDPKDRKYFNEHLYMYPDSKAKFEIFEFGTHNVWIDVGQLISTATGSIEYDMGTNSFVGCGIPKGEISIDDYPCKVRVRCHPIGYNYDIYIEGAEEGFHGFDFYEIDEILEKTVKEEFEDLTSE